MLKNKEVKDLIVSQIIVFIISLIITFSFSILMFSFYKNEIIKNNSYIIGNILEKYPELENNIIDSILTNEGNI